MCEDSVQSVARRGELDTPHAFVQELMNPDLKGQKRTQVLESLKVSLTSKPVSWAVEFGEKGLNAILRNLTYCCDNVAERRSTYECVRCLKAFMNNTFGLKKILEHEEALTIMSRTIDPSDPPTMLEAVRLLAAICLVPPNGHDKALEGITVCGEIRSQERFLPIISGLGMRDNPAMQFGLKKILEHEEALTIMSRTIDPSDPPTMLEAVRLLAAICLVPPNGHDKALEGITVCGEIRSQERFLPIISGLGMRDNPAMQVACIQLVNAIVSAPDDLDFRMHLRNEFMRTGLIDLLGWLDQQEDEEVKTHLNIFHGHKEDDQEEFSHRYDNIRVEIEYPFLTVDFSHIHLFRV
ncbi:diaphanous-related formin [Plakobranchus ocellatus]|uniref:Diaphanous-related formin n=1 Tax=Plakobranchus ocellatus TaxID=259542 RepID=A0AAV3Z0L3_9GAST|nr:diaphanous-related formin [Plakobranchus ocellatus]